MTGFLRALRGELYALIHRRQVRIAVLVVVLGVVLRIAAGYWLGGMTSGGGGDELFASAHSNFWPRFAQGAHFGLILAELSVLVVISGLLPREIGLGAIRDPLVRRISRPAFLCARAVVAALLPLVLAGASLLASSAAASIFYDAGHVVTAPLILDEDPVLVKDFGAWCGENHVRPDELAAWLRLVEDEGMEDQAAAAQLGLPGFELPDRFFVQVPILQFFESDVRDGIVEGLIHGLLPLVALGLFALMFSVVMPTGVLAAGLALGAVLLFGVFFAPDLDDWAWWIFANWLPGMGHDSQLELARLVADGYPEPRTAPDALGAGTWGSVIEAAGFLILVLAVFPRRSL